ncbi:nostrin-like [Liolophura sinensis]|uniref:nostrin-like n=1 Tax=Liolophura sinensis TaxID=3198878 RepID=UPI003158FD2E
MALFRENFWGLNGFEELRKYIKQGSEFCKEVVAILQERSDLENNYAKNLTRLSIKLNKAASNSLGTLAAGWNAVATQMENEADLHKNLATSLHDDICKPLKSLIEEQHKARKPVESMVEKSLKCLLDRRNEESKCKKSCFSSAKDFERSQDALLNGRLGKGKSLSERDISKLEKKTKVSLNSLRKADKDYTEASQKAEQVRQDWEVSVAKGSGQMQEIEEERIRNMQDYLNKYNSFVSLLGPKLTQACAKLHEAVISVDLEVDLRTVIQQKGTGPNQPEQILIDCYAEDMSFNMNKDRRRDALTSYLLTLQQSIERERKAKEGVEKLKEVYQNRPNFADQEAQEDTRQKLIGTTYTLNLLEASHYKICSALASIDGRAKPQHRFSQYIEQSKDKQGLPLSLLKLPLNLAMEGTGYDLTPMSMDSPGSQSYDMIDDGDPDFDDDFEDEDTIIGKCRVLYEYQANQSDELSIRPGEVINIYEKQDDDWWQGELRGTVGIFPANYVQEMR